ncbi:MAG TPA: aminotransferase class IV [Bacteroidales bacterium]|nr:aminotransferase class IV [Bacteroidales bacterium]
MPECILSSFSDNGKLKPVDSFPEINKSDYLYLYEVIRVIDGKLLFLEDHIERLKQSISLAEKELGLPEQIVAERMKQVITTNSLHEGNLKLVLLFKKNKNTKKGRMLSCITPHYYPPKALYQTGIQTVTLEAERMNPNVKMLHEELKTRIEEKTGSTDYFEVLLVNRSGNITEGSKSNVFFVKENTVITPPAADILEGITRKKVIEICRNNHIDFREETIPLQEIPKMRAAFITGTSPKVLPVKKINELAFQVPDVLVDKIMHAYDEEINRYLKSCK